MSVWEGGRYVDGGLSSENRNGCVEKVSVDGNATPCGLGGLTTSGWIGRRSNWKERSRNVTR